MPNVGGVDVSRETFEKLERYQALLTKWNGAINLVAKSTLVHFWDRHVVDSAQLFNFAPQTGGTWLDAGSGGGLPGLVIAIIAKEKSPGLKMLLVESDQRKATFLRTVARDLSLDVTVATERVEALAPTGADVFSARALASLDMLLGFAERHLSPTGIAVFPKGERYEDEIAISLKQWCFDVVTEPSLTDTMARILVVKGIKRVDE